ncbi:hypothetical protein [Anaerovibrio sp.]|uniref:hypothetical protein n=1 Tax=Anaerovibrio sp. TaxID=1872532 RepID=UPI003890B017
MTWIDYQESVKNNEIAVLAISTVLLFIGVLCELLVSNGVIFIEVDNLSGISLTLLQIQATILTLTITIIALLSGVISTSYMGIPVAVFILKNKPYILTQKYIIIFEFAGLVFSIFCHLLSFYNVVITFFIVAVIIILKSIFDVCDIFRGKQKILNEIEVYVLYLIDNADNRAEVCKNFIYDWKNVAPVQSTEDFKFYSGMFFKFVNAMLVNEMQMQNVNSHAEDIALFLLMHDLVTCKMRGICFVGKFYNNLWCWFNDNQDVASNLKNTLQLIAKVDNAWYRALNTIDAEMIEQYNFNFNYFSESIIRVASFTEYALKYDSYRVSSVNGLARIIGKYINKQYGKSNIVNSDFWQSILTDDGVWYFNDVPKESEWFYYKSLALRDFNLFYGFLVNKQIDYIDEKYFEALLQKQYQFDNLAYILKVMLIHCFMYYIAYREDTSCVDKSVQERVKRILVNNDIKNLIIDFYYSVSGNKEFLEADIERQMEEILGNYELMPKSQTCKAMIMSDVIREYFLYVALIINRYSFRDTTLEKLLKTQKYYSYLVEHNYAKLKSKIAEMCDIFEINRHNNGGVVVDMDEILFPFVNVMNKKYKQYIIHEAQQKQMTYEHENIHDKAQKYIEDWIREEINSKIIGFNTKCDRVKKYDNVHIFRITDFTDGIGESKQRIPMDYAISNFFRRILEKLSKDFGMKNIDRSELFKSDEEFRNYIIQNQYDTLFGSQYVFTFSDYKGYTEHMDFLDSLHCILVPGGNSGMALSHNSLLLTVDDLHVDIFSPSIEYFDNITKDIETGLYNYCPFSGMSLNFEENELEELLHNERKIVDVYVSVTIGFSEDHGNGIIITRQRDF